MQRPDVHRGPPEPAPLDVEQVYREYVGYVFRLIQRFGVGRDEVEDATQEVFLIVHRRLPEFDPSRGSMKTWLFAMARGVAANRRRGRERRLRVVHPGDGRGCDARPTPEQRADHRQTLERVGHFLSTLPPHQRQVFELIDIEGMRGPEVSEVLGVNINTIYTRLRLARHAFKRFAGTLEAEGSSPGGGAAGPERGRRAPDLGGRREGGSAPAATGTERFPKRGRGVSA